MICNKCKREINNNNQFCNFCGNKLYETKSKIHIDLTKGQKTTIIGMLCVIVILLSILILTPSSSTGNSRTIMIYVVGSNLETDSKIVSKDLSAIDPKKIDLSKINILLYTGGTETWHNFVSNEDNGVYLLGSNGFKKIDSQEQLNMGDPNTLSNFLKLGYEKYPADNYDLVLYNHGGAIDGAIYDDISGDNLSLVDMETALKNSPFNRNNKLETVLFRTCLNGTLELANVFNDYSNYLIGSEEISYGGSHTDVLSFFNDVKYNDTGLEYGTKFVNSYERQMDILDPYDSVTQTYSVIDLTKIDKVNEELSEYISSIDLSKNYNNIAKIRTNIYQYGMDSTSYDMIDLYTFIEQTGAYATKNNDKLLKIIDEAIVYNKSNESTSHGISIYFPYKGKKGAQSKYLAVYESLEYSKPYKEFIKTFNQMQHSQSAFKFEFSKNEINNNSDNEVSIKLSNEQIENYSFATFTIFKQDPEHNNYYTPIYNTDEVTLNNEGLLISNFKNKLVQIQDEETDKYNYMLTYYRKSSNNSRRATAILYNTNLEFTDDGFMSSADIYFNNDKDGNPIISTAKLISDNERIDGVLLNLDNYNKYELWQYSYRILDDKGNVLDTSEWEGAPVIHGYGGELSKIKMRYASLDEEDNYYGLFIVNDINGNSSYSKLIKIGE